MKELSNYEMINTTGGSCIMITPLYGFIKIMKWISKFISPRF